MKCVRIQRPSLSFFFSPDRFLTSNGTRWGRVKFLSHLEAQRAINAVDGAEPFKIRVQFSLSESERDAKRKEEEEVLKRGEEINRRYEEFARTGGIGMKMEEGDEVRLPRGRGKNLTVNERYSCLKLIFSH